MWVHFGAFVLMVGALDINSMWDFRDPAESERRFEARLQGATLDEALILETQIARTYSLRKDFARALEILSGVNQRLEYAESPEVSTRYYLELGRSLVSATRRVDKDDAERAEEARRAYQAALEIAQANSLDGLAIDAIHMMAFVDSSPKEQLAWALLGLEIARKSSQAEASKWQASLLHNSGYARHQLAEYSDALSDFEAARELRELEGDPWRLHVAGWMVAWTLRHLGETERALSIQLELERGRESAGEPDPYVYEELALLYEQANELQRASHYRALAKESRN